MKNYIIFETNYKTPTKKAEFWLKNGTLPNQELKLPS